MTNPIDIIANAIRTADGSHTMGAGQLAEVMAEALNDDQVIAAAIDALKTASWGDAVGVTNLEPIARTVLRSVGGAS